MMTCRSDYYKEDQPTGWPSLSIDAMPKGRNDIAAYKTKGL